uniref:Uncharacterized protein n=1 Tax=Anopheles culicifacies TaxID=139723 RepID=A0A182M898_9DIPT
MLRCTALVGQQPPPRRCPYEGGSCPSGEAFRIVKFRGGEGRLKDTKEDGGIVFTSNIILRPSRPSSPFFRLVNSPSPYRPPLGDTCYKSTSISPCARYATSGQPTADGN